MLANVTKATSSIASALMVACDALPPLYALPLRHYMHFRLICPPLACARVLLFLSDTYIENVIISFSKKILLLLLDICLYVAW